MGIGKRALSPFDGGGEGGGEKEWGLQAHEMEIGKNSSFADQRWEEGMDTLQKSKKADGMATNGSAPFI